LFVVYHVCLVNKDSHWRLKFVFEKLRPNFGLFTSCKNGKVDECHFRPQHLIYFWWGLLCDLEDQRSQ